LNKAGISCPVVFKVRDGTYIEQFIINDIVGSSPENTITFESESGDSTKVMVVFDVGSSFTAMLKGAKYINFRRIGFGGYYGLAINGYSNHLTIEHCYLQADYVGIGISEGSNEIRIANNNFRGANTGLLISGSSAVHPNNVEVMNNVFANQRNISVLASHARTVSINGNRVDTRDCGFELGNSNDLIVINNRVRVVTLESRSNCGLSLSSNDTVSIYNNYIQVEGQYPGVGVSLYNCSHNELYFNSINVSTTDIGQEGKGLWIRSGQKNIVKNNILNIETVGFPVVISEGTSGFTLDYNDYYSPSGLIGRNGKNDYYRLTDWAIALGQDAYSIAENPFYTSRSNLSMNQVLLNNAGIPITGIGEDIDGAPRNATHPDLGAK